MNFAMDDDSDDNSPVLSEDDYDIEYNSTANEVEEDLTGGDELLSHRSSLASLNLSDGTPNIKARAYQTEMLEESLKQNTIVAMDTGSGKTHIAVLRMQYELERIPPNQFIWFLAPTVALCSQQFEYIQSQISAVQIKFLSGADGVDRWTEQSLWNAVLKNVKIVVSTYQILLDALTHGFVRINSLALIVFDESHNCVGRHPGSRIMKSFYHPQKGKGGAVPHILGLTASPIMRSDPTSLGKIEETMDALCRTPTKHRAELRLQVNLPIMSQSFYQTPAPVNLLTGYTRTIESLGKAYGTLKLSEDPYVLGLIKDNSEMSMRKLQKVRLSHKTWSQIQMKTLHATSLKIASELGAWAADYYISEVITNFVKITEQEGAIQTSSLGGVSRAERQYLVRALKTVEINRTANTDPVSFPLVSDKVKKLIDFLVQEEPHGFSGIIFVQERAVVAVLAQLLTIHPTTRERFKIGTIVGSSISTNRSDNIGELHDVKSQKHTLSLFKANILNLIVATSVLEEGIDVPACNLVLCFQRPANLKSFVQRRGRARQKESKLILLLDSTVDKLSEWQQLESDMKAIYEDEMRTLQEVLVLEDTEPHDVREFRVEHTDALLDLDNAVQHLFRFCATLPSTDYVDLRPDFVCYSDGPSLVGAKVTLPISVNAAVRSSRSRASWMSERNAIKDAAFEAYIALYKAGLVNDNLLPLLRHDPIVDQLKNSMIETRASLVLVNEQLNPWVHIADIWNTSGGTYRSTILLNDLEIVVHLPKPISSVAPFHVYWDSKTPEWRITIQPAGIEATTDLSNAIKDTWSILQASFGSRFPIQRRQHVVLFSTNEPISLGDRMSRQEIPGQPVGLIRDISNPNIPYIFRKHLSTKPLKEMVQHPYDNYEEVDEETPHLSLTRLPKRFDFLHKVPPGNEPQSEKPFSVVIPTAKCAADTMPFKYVQFGLLIPSIMRRLAIYLLADTLSTTLLRDVGIQNIDLIVTAISASSANEETNYQRLEFIGDSVLKLCASVQLTAEYPLWHEGYLSKKKDMLVSNSRLSRAAIESGLDKFIVTRPFTGHKWRPSYVDDLIAPPGNLSRQMSTKVLADVVEALIGASMVDGGISKALACLRVFLPELEWQPLEQRQMSLYQEVLDSKLPVTLLPLESFMGYQFRKKSLLVEAMTHASCNVGTGSLERFEFLGDSILDRLVVSALEEHVEELSHVNMHLFRTALVNADFLAFLCMEWGIEEETVDIVRTDRIGGEDNPGNFTQKSTTTFFPLWGFMRHNSPPLGIIQVETGKRHTRLRDEINAAIKAGSHYPWALLARLQALKFYSDLIESVLGAIWIDSGSMEVCQNVVERMGILPYLRRILKDKVHLWHPKEELGKLADTKTVKYTVGTVKKSGDDLADHKYWCKVSVGDEQVAEIDDGVSREEAKTKAAEMAVRIIKERKEGCNREDIAKDNMEQSVDLPMVMG